MPKIITGGALALFALLTVISQPFNLFSMDSLPNAVRESIRNRIESHRPPDKIQIGNARIHANISLPRFYENRGFSPAWIDTGAIRPEVNQLIAILRMSDDEGLDPADYHLNEINLYLELLREKPALDPRALAEFDLLMSDAFLLYSSHILAGAVDPETFDKEWHANRSEADLAMTLQQALSSGDLRGTIANLSPQDGAYARLKIALKAYRVLGENGGWPVIPSGPKLQKNDTGTRVHLLQERLKATGELSESSDYAKGLFDDVTVFSLKAFQRRHGLTADGIAGPNTLAALNVPAAERIRQIALNLERWRWLPQTLGDKYVLANIPDFRLDVIENGASRLNMRIVVGRNFRRTPVFSDHITHLVLNPRWEIPHSIAVKDKLALIKKDPAYLKKMHITVLRGWGSDAREIDPSTINWTILNERTFSYRLRQAPGPWNALGSIKFMFPNKYNVYLHGTPEQRHFSQETRSFSSGCIRLETPLDLAVYLLASQNGFSRDSIQHLIDLNVEQTIRLTPPVAVHLLYWTAWVSGDGIVEFRSDIYGRDKLLATAMAEKATGRGDRQPAPKN